MYYKAPDNSVHYLDDDKFSHLLPVGSVPITDEEAREYQIANTPKPDPIEEAKAYLTSTDWYVTRFAETGKAVPEDVTIKRSEARKLI